MKKIKWGVIGTAGIAKSCTIPGMIQAYNCELYAIAGRSIDKAEQFKEKFGFEKAYGSYKELLDAPEVEAVYIALPNTLHYEWAVKAMESGKHVLCEKPLAPCEKQVKELFETAKENHVYLMEAFAYQHSPYIIAIKKEIEDGTKGSITGTKFAFNGEGELSYTIRTAEGQEEVKTVEVPQNYRLEVEQFGRCIDENEIPAVTEEFSLKNARLVERILEEIGY